jgi:hypothetical protein
MSFGTIRELISLNNAEIVAYLHDNTKFLSQLFELCSNRNSGDDTWRNGYLFIRELFDISKPLGPQQQVPIPQPRPQTLNPEPWTLNPKPEALDPKPYTLNPKPETLN